MDGVKQIYFKDPDGYWIEINDARGNLQSTGHYPLRMPFVVPGLVKRADKGSQPLGVKASKKTCHPAEGSSRR